MYDGVQTYTDESGRVIVYVSSEATLEAITASRDSLIEQTEYIKAMTQWTGEALQMIVVLFGVIITYIITRGVRR